MAKRDDIDSKLDRLGSSLMNAILGALILWIGQITFRHAGILAGVDDRIAAVNQQVGEVAKRQESLRTRLETVVTELKDGSRSQLSQADGDRLFTQVRQAEQSFAELERRFAERLAALDIKLTALETDHRDSKEVAALKMEIAQLRGDLTRAAVAQEGQSQGSERFARGNPVFLPPVDGRR